MRLAIFLCALVICMTTVGADGPHQLVIPVDFGDSSCVKIDLLGGNYFVNHVFDTADGRVFDVAIIKPLANYIGMVTVENQTKVRRILKIPLDSISLFEDVNIVPSDKLITGCEIILSLQECESSIVTGFTRDLRSFKLRLQSCGTDSCSLIYQLSDSSNTTY